MAEKFELPCGIVEDLLPTYVDGLTGEESTEAVREHLDRCEKCREKYQAMRAASAGPAPETDAQNKEIDYLKGVRRRTRRRVVAAAVAAVLVLSAALFIRGSVIGTSAAFEDVNYTVSEGADTISVRYQTPWGSRAQLRGLKVREENGAVYLTLRRAARADAALRDEGQVWEQDKDGVQAVYLCGKLIWKDGLAVDETAYRLAELATPYVGSAPAVHELVEQLDPGFGGWTIELQTAQEPYGCTIRFEGPMDDWSSGVIDAAMQGVAEQMLALVENLGSVSWTYPAGDGTAHTAAVTLAEVDGQLPALTEGYNRLYGAGCETRGSVKDYAGSAEDVALLREILKIVH